MAPCSCSLTAVSLTSFETIFSFLLGTVMSDIQLQNGININYLVNLPVAAHT